ncbi:hypothetical protein ABK040_005465 [Willaertia magna]
MEANKDEAVDLIHLAKEAYYKEHNHDKALRFLNKAKKLYPTLNPKDYGFKDFTTISDIIHFINTKKHSQQHSEHSSSHNHNSHKSHHSSHHHHNHHHSSSSSSSNSHQQQESNSRPFTKEQAEEVQKLLKKKGNYYSILDVEKTATQQEIKKSYRKLALKFHPDRNPVPESTEAFKLISAAYMCLSDEEKRKMYDQFGTDDAQKISMNRFNGFEGMFRRRGEDGGMYFSRGGRYGNRMNMTDDELFQELFAQMFGGHPSRFYGQRFDEYDDDTSHRQNRRRATHNVGDNHHTFSFGCLQFLFIFFILFVTVLPNLLSPLFGGSSTPSSSQSEVYGNGYYTFEPANYYSHTNSFTYKRAQKKFDITYFIHDRVYRSYGAEALNNYKSQILQDYKSYLNNRCAEQKYYENNKEVDKSVKRQWYVKYRELNPCKLFNEMFVGG